MLLGFVIVIQKGIPQFGFRRWEDLSDDVLVDFQKRR